AIGRKIKLETVGRQIRVLVVERGVEDVDSNGRVERCGAARSSRHPDVEVGLPRGSEIGDEVSRGALDQVSVLGCQRSVGLRAARASSRRPTRDQCGADFTSSGSFSASSLMRIIASAKASIVSFDSVSVGSIMSAPFTTRGKYTVGGWKP